MEEREEREREKGAASAMGGETEVAGVMAATAGMGYLVDRRALSPTRLNADSSSWCRTDISGAASASATPPS